MLCQRALATKEVRLGIDDVQGAYVLQALAGYITQLYRAGEAEPRFG